MVAANDNLPDRVAALLKRSLGGESIIDVSRSGIRDNLHVLVVSRDLDNKSEMQKQDLLWTLLEKSGELTESEIGRISMILPLSVDELRR